MRKPAPYCTPRMFTTLCDIAAGSGGADVPAKVLDALRSRGWIDRRDRVTDKGRAYIAARAGRS